MRRLLIFLAFASLGLAATSPGAIDLTPVPSDHEENGFKYRMLTFKHGTRRINYVPPGSWMVRGAPDRLQMSSPASKFAEASIGAVPLEAPVPLDETRMLALEQQVLASLPPGSQSPEVIERVQNPVVLGGNLSFGVQVSYQVLGRTFHRMVIFVHAPDVQLTFRATAEKSEYEKFYSTFRQSLTSWHWTEPPAPK